jgi:hypothetical protein
MNTKNMWIASLSGAALSLLVSNLPFIGFVNCLLCAGFWGASIFAVWFYKRLNGTVTMREGVKLGALTGALAGAFGFLLSFAGLAGLQGMINDLGPLLSPEDLEGIKEIPAWGELLFNLLGVIFDVGFGTLGGWIGGTLLDPARKTRKAMAPDAGTPL